ncbi:MFS transporter [Simiduia agarivorans]|uniref:Multidrug resistance transporter n=1 Tax=Simiduia agarivorans (strain DSM 21679 / JCM 13881 / BCRC 17597 / SA1) TaxID=1117647 RepID=K4KPV5_SIMAS|nr:MFS transporter [Simiduia agarivorans]AFV00286.1 Multidrug resistance transporter [Simiduia agarivorans SA1 = DSM 21679]
MSPRYLTPFIAALVALSPLAMDSYLPAMPLLAAHFGVSDAALSWTISNFLLGLAAGQLLGGAASDQKGRRLVLLTGLCLFVLSSLALSLADSLLAANSWRLLQGFAGGVVMVASTAMVKDVTPPDQLAAQITQIVFVVMLTPIVAPIVGSLMLPLGWRSIFLLSFGAALIMLVLAWWKVAETAAQYTNRLSLRDGMAQYVYIWRFELDGVRMVRWQALSLSCSALLSLVFVTLSSPLLMGYYQLSADMFPYAFGCFAVSILIGNRIGKWMVGRYTPLVIFRAGLLVQSVAVASLLLAATLISVPLWLCLVLFMTAIGTGSAIGPSGTSLFLNLLDKYYGSATAYETTQRFTLGALLGSAAVALPFDLVLSGALVMSLSLLVSILAYWRVSAHWPAEYRQ